MGSYVSRLYSVVERKLLRRGKLEPYSSAKSRALSTASSLGGGGDTKIEASSLEKGNHTALDVQVREERSSDLSGLYGPFYSCHSAAHYLSVLSTRRVPTVHVALPPYNSQ